MVHPEGEPCPFQPDGYPIGIMGTCCSLRGKAAAYELEALGERDLANRLYESVSRDRAQQTAEELDAAATRLELAYHDAKTKPPGFEWGGDVDLKTGTVLPGGRSSFDEAIAEIRLAARWYRKVSDLGFGVFAWY